MTEKESVDESYQLFRIGFEFLGSQNTALHSVKLRLLIFMVVRLPTSEVRAEPGQSQTIDPEAMSQYAQ